MVAYSFSKRFGAPILAGTKRQTIRGARKRHALPGEELQLYTGMRTRHCKLIGRARCINVRPIQLWFKAEGTGVQGWDASERITTELLLDAFAILDGFQNWLELRTFWAEQHPGVEEFEGVRIRWEDLR